MISDKTYRRVILYVALQLISWCVLYAAAAFITWAPSPFDWGEGIRSLVAVGALVTMAFSAVLLPLFFDD